MEPTFVNVPEKISFPEEEARVLEFWEKIRAFESSYEQSVKDERPVFTFYDGPPFATGLPHYGHILAGTIKDVVTRFAHQTGHRVQRRFGWDCHGLPVEYEVDRALGISGPEDVAKMGIANYNKECRSIVMRYAEQWEHIVKRMGRWVDFKQDYKTLDISFMESVWWVFSQLYSKGLVYRGFKVMPYSTACNTPLSNFEAGLNYQDVSDPAVVVSFPIIDASIPVLQENAHLLAWTTTPWTLPSNVALCVNPEFTYLAVKDTQSGKVFVICDKRIEEVYPAKKKGKKDQNSTASYTVLANLKGSDLVGLHYTPLFDYFVEDMSSLDAFRVVSDGYVTEDSGTGIVHQAPAFGEDDYRVCLSHNVIAKGFNIVCPVDDSGRFTDQVKDFSGRYVKEADRDIIAKLKEMGRLVKNSQIVHSYPHCWRSDSPLIYKAVPSWFVDVPAIREKLLANNEKTYWVPAFVKEKRFHNWLLGAREWAVSRNRYWGTPLPIWMSDDSEEIVVVGSVDELKKLTSAADISDIHRDSIDHLTIPSQKGKGTLRRVPEVFDCWFESGSMPYAQQHYPFENKDTFEHGFPADFIAEGLDQTRGWFYTLMVISTALFDKPPFKNLIVNGLVLAEDGKKMSKRLKNYPDPMNVVSEHGADALRVYLINSPVVRAESLRFKESGVRDLVKEIFIPWFNTYRLFISQARRLERESKAVFTTNPKVHLVTDNVMDKWILSSFQSLIKLVRGEMTKYRLDTVMPFLIRFIDQLSRWFVRFNKGRMKGDFGAEKALYSLQTLYEVLLGLCKLMSPYTPFFVEYMYQNLRKALPENVSKESVHFCMIPEWDSTMVDERIEDAVSSLQTVMELGRSAREKSNQPSFRFPYPELVVIHPSSETLENVNGLKEYVLEQLNVKKLNLTSEVLSLITVSLDIVRASLGPKLKQKIGAFSKALKSLSTAEIFDLQSKGKMLVKYHNGRENDEQEIILNEDVNILYSFSGDTGKYEAVSQNGFVVLVDKNLDEECVREGFAREIVSRVQMLRKEAKLTIEDSVHLFIDIPSESSKCLDAYEKCREMIEEKLRQPLLPLCSSTVDDSRKVIDAERAVLEEKIRLTITRV